jgi:pimeloyl-ACP methyl ester carboxylesterase
VRQWGTEGPVCVLLHGTGEGAYVWAAVVDSILDTHRVIAVDFRGHGDSGWDADQRYSIDSYATDAKFVLDELRIDRAVLVGHSAGAAVAASLGAAFPQLAGGIVLVDFGPEVNQSTSDHARVEFLRQFQAYRSVTEYVFDLQDRRPLVSPGCLRQLAQDALRHCEDGLFRLKCDPAVAVEVDDMMERAEIRRRFTMIACETLVLRGGASAMLSADDAERATRLLRRGLVRSVECAGHAVMTDNPSAFSRALRTFLRSLALNAPSETQCRLAKVGF